MSCDDGRSMCCAVGWGLVLAAFLAASRVVCTMRCSEPVFRVGGAVARSAYWQMQRFVVSGLGGWARRASARRVIATTLREP